jgi:hypothetical protein
MIFEGAILVMKNRECDIFQEILQLEKSIKYLIYLKKEEKKHESSFNIFSVFSKSFDGIADVYFWRRQLFFDVERISIFSE